MAQADENACEKKFLEFLDRSDYDTAAEAMFQLVRTTYRREEESFLGKAITEGG